MDEENIQRKMDFIVEQQAKFSVDIELLKEAQKQQSESLKQQAENINHLAENINRLFETVTVMQETVTVMQAQADADRIEIREAINNLIVANEVTRKLSEDVARLAIQTSRRVDSLEEK